MHGAELIVMTQAMHQGNHAKDGAACEEGHQAKQRTHAKANFHAWAAAILNLHQVLIDTWRVQHQR